MIKILAEFTVAEENIGTCKLLFEELQTKSLQEEGCIEYNLFQVSRQENTFIVYEVFKDKEAQEFHKSTSHYNYTLKILIESLIINKNVRFLI